MTSTAGSHTPQRHSDFRVTTVTVLTRFLSAGTPEGSSEDRISLAKTRDAVSPVAPSALSSTNTRYLQCMRTRERDEEERERRERGRKEGGEEGEEREGTEERKKAKGRRR